MSERDVGEHRDPWLAIELRHLAALSAIATEGTFSEAALSLGYVQSAISGQVATLERLTGARLVERVRGPRQQGLTPAGRVLLAHAHEILAELEHARERLAVHTRAERSALRVCVTGDVPDRIVARVLAAALAPASGITVSRVGTVDAEAAADALAGEEADVALTTLPLAAAGVGTAELARQTHVAVVPAGSRLARRRRAPTLAELSRLPLVAWSAGRDPSPIERELRARALSPDVVVRADSSDTVVALVAQGVGAAVLPRGAVDDDAALAALALRDVPPAPPVGLAWLRRRVADARIHRFVDVACGLRDAL